MMISFSAKFLLAWKKRRVIEIANAVAEIYFLSSTLWQAMTFFVFDVSTETDDGGEFLLLHSSH